jgi:glutamate synthase (ferredoxin)
VLVGLRSDTSIVVETAQAFSTHHAAMLIGYGAHALCPYLAYETARQWRLSSRTQSLVKSGKVTFNLNLSFKQVRMNNAGLVRMSLVCASFFFAAKL